MKKLFLLIFIILNSCILFAQQEIIESLKSSIASAPENTTKVENYLKLSELYFLSQNFDSVYIYAGKALYLSEKLNYPGGIINSNQHIGRVFSFRGRYDSAYAFFSNSLMLADSIKDSRASVIALISLGENARAYKAYEQGIDYLFRGLEINKTINDSTSLAKIYNRIAAIYFELRNFDSTAKYAGESMAISEKLDNKELIGNNLNILGVNYALIKDYENGIEYLTRAQDIYTEINSPDLPNVLNSLGSMHNLTGHSKEAIKNGLKSFNISVNNGIIAYVQLASDVLSEAYEAEGNYREALKYIKISTSCKDSIYNIITANKINEYQSRFDIEKKEKENELLKKEQRIKDIQINASVLVILAALILVISFLINFRKTRRVNYTLKHQKEELEKISEELKKLNKTKDKFFSIIAHDLRNPFNSIIGFSDLLANNYEDFDDTEKKEMLLNIKDSSLNAHQLLENLLQWSRSQSGTMQVTPEEIDLNKIALENIGLLRHTSQFKAVILHSDIPSNTIVYADSKMISTVVRNLISNGVKFTKNGGEVKISSKRENDFVIVTISDTGIGIKKESLDKLFRLDDSYKRAGTLGEEGTGLGLIVCKEFIEKNGGKIWVESEEHKGSRFIFTIPTQKKE